MRKHFFFLLLIFTILTVKCLAQVQANSEVEINNLTPSKSIYFDWINRNWYGSNEKKIEANLRFFKWLHDEYGMQLDIYLMDAADIDQGPNCAPDPGLPAYGSIETEWFKKRFPHGFGPLAELAKSFNCRLGVWLGPDGYGTTEEEASKRKEMLVKFCKEYNFALFKFDACCSDLNPQNLQHFIETMLECRRYSPDLIILNHRITLNEEARKLTTTFLWEGRETYVDVNISNDQPAPHHREGNLSRGLPPGLLRLTEDHGVCLSSALNSWDDDLILQAFNRNLILSPEIYGSPFLLSDDQFPRLARIYNIHRLYNDILVNGKMLPEEKYGKFAVSRGDSSTRLLTFRNLSWQPIHVSIRLDSSIGLLNAGNVEVLQYHPAEQYLGTFQSGSEVSVTVLPFRTSLVKISAKPNPEFLLKGVAYNVIKSVPGQPVIAYLIGLPGEKINFSFSDGHRKYNKASLNGKDISSILNGKKVSFTFSGKRRNDALLTKFGDMQLTSLPANAEKFIEFCLFAADNNALEVRELKHAGQTIYPRVQDCRDVFFNDTLFSGIGVWDKYAFDGDLSTSFKVRLYNYMSLKVSGGAFRLDLGETTILDKILFKGIPSDYTPEKVEISDDLSTWQTAGFELTDGVLNIELPQNKSFRYVRLAKAPVEVAEIEGFSDKISVKRDKWKASNLFGTTDVNTLKPCWESSGKLKGIGKGAYLSVTVPAECKEGSVFAYMIVDDIIVPAIDRAPSFPYNNWEHFNTSLKSLTFYIPVDEKMEGKDVQVMMLSADGNLQNIKPEIWLSNPELYEEAELIIE